MTDAELVIDRFTWEPDQIVFQYFNATECRFVQCERWYLEEFKEAYAIERLLTDPGYSHWHANVLRPFKSKDGVLFRP